MTLSTSEGPEFLEIPPHAFPAIRRLLRIAQGDTGQSVRVRRFLLAWWGGTDTWGPVDLWGVDERIAIDMLAVLQLIAAARAYPNSLPLGPDQIAIFRQLAELDAEGRR